MRVLIVIVGLLLVVAACRRPSSQIRATLTPTTVDSLSADVPDYSQYLKAGDDLVALPAMHADGTPQTE